MCWRPCRRAVHPVVAQMRAKEGAPAGALPPRHAPQHEGPQTAFSLCCLPLLPRFYRRTQTAASWRPCWSTAVPRKTACSCRCGGAGGSAGGRAQQGHSLMEGSCLARQLNAASWRQQGAAAPAPGPAAERADECGTRLPSHPTPQMQADILQVPVRRPAHLETTSLGAALAAGIGVGFWSEAEAFTDLKHNTGGPPDCAAARSCLTYVRSCLTYVPRVL